MALEEEKSAQEVTRENLYAKIDSALGMLELKGPRDAVVAAPAIADLAKAWHRLDGGQPTDTGCSCSDK